MRAQTLASSLLISAVVMGCVGPGRRSRPSRDSSAEMSRSAATPSLTTQLQELVDRRDHRATIKFTAAALDDVTTPLADDHTRGIFEHARARAQAAVGLHLSALGSYQRAWHLLASDGGDLCATAREDWADEQMRAGQAAAARTHYLALLSGDGLTSAQKRRLSASLVVACETVGATAEAIELRATLGRSADKLLAATRTRLAGLVYLRPAPAPAPATLRSQPIPSNSRDILPALRTRLLWSARPIAGNHDSMTRIRAITVHHSAFAAPAAGSTALQIRAIQADHQGGRGWADIGYHFLIDAQGAVWEGRRLIYQGAHAGSNAPGLNVGNIGVCLLGNFETGPVPAAQEAALLKVLGSLTRWFALSAGAVQPHSHFKPSTLCPGIQLKAIVARYRGEGRRSLARQ